VENVCIKHIRKLSKGVQNTERIIILENLKDELDELLNDPNERVVLEYFNITAWVNSKIYKVSFSEAVKQSVELSRTSGY
jgi:hypothetical protein